MGNTASSEKEEAIAAGSVGSTGSAGSLTAPFSERDPHRSLSESVSPTSARQRQLQQQAQTPSQPPSSTSTTRSRRTLSSASDILYSYPSYQHSQPSSSSSQQAPSAAQREFVSTTRSAASPLPPLGSRPSDSAALAHLLSTQNSISSAKPIMGQTQSRQNHASGNIGAAASPAKPVAIPEAQAASKKQQDQQRQRDERSFPIIPIGPPPTSEPASYLLPDPEFGRPPRLPLPIGEEQIEGSPILSPVVPAAPLEDLEPLQTLPPLDSLKPEEEGAEYPLVSRASELSHTTADEEEDVGDDLGTVRGGVLPPVSTVLEWLEGGNKVYVTGTFADWDRKYRLTKNGPSKHKDALSTTINLQPGTYHLRFIVDGEMILSKNLPLAVDFTNSLVNYIEVFPKETTATAGPQLLMPPDLATQPTSQAIDLQSGIPEGKPIQPTSEAAKLQDSRTPTLPPTPSIGPVTSASPVPPHSETPSQRPEMRKPPSQSHHHARYTSTIPQFLRDSDTAESTQQFRRSLALQESLPGPPTLPMFLNKSILNGIMPMKDDASVLILPNHTVLNHLATTAIRSGVLATSATTRYKRKFLTTIMYKPTDAED